MDAPLTVLVTSHSVLNAFSMRRVMSKSIHPPAYSTERQLNPSQQLKTPSGALFLTFCPVFCITFAILHMSDWPARPGGFSPMTTQINLLPSKYPHAISALGRSHSSAPQCRYHGSRVTAQATSLFFLHPTTPASHKCQCRTRVMATTWANWTGRATFEAPHHLLG